MNQHDFSFFYFALMIICLEDKCVIYFVCVDIYACVCVCETERERKKRGRGEKREGVCLGGVTSFRKIHQICAVAYSYNGIEYIGQLNRFVCYFDFNPPDILGGKSDHKYILFISTWMK